MTSRTIYLLTALALGLVVGGCEQAERPLSYDKGVYGGTPDQPLTDEQREQLRQRGNYQRD